MSDYNQLLNEMSVLNDIYHKATKVYYTVFDYLRLDENLSKDECDKKAGEAAAKMRNKLLIEFSNERINKAFNLEIPSANNFCN